MRNKYVNDGIDFLDQQAGTYYDELFREVDESLRQEQLEAHRRQQEKDSEEYHQQPLKGGVYSFGPDAMGAPWLFTLKGKLKIAKVSSVAALSVISFALGMIFMHHLLT